MHYWRCENKANKTRYIYVTRCCDICRHLSTKKIQNNETSILHSVKITNQLSFKTSFFKSGPAYHRHILIPRHQTLQRHSGVAVTKPISSVPLFSEFFSIIKTHATELNIVFIFDRCRRSSAAVAPVKYKCDSNNQRGTFARTKILLTGKLTNRALVTPPQMQSLELPCRIWLLKTQIWYKVVRR